MNWPSISRFGILLAAASAVSIAALTVYLEKPDRQEPEVPPADRSIGNTGAEETSAPQPIPETRTAATPEKPGTTARSLKFPDGDVVEFSIKSAPEVPEFPLEPLIDIYGSLRESAVGGDGDAAYVLSTMLGGCTMAYQTDEALEEAIDQLQQTRTIPDAQTGKAIPVNLGGGSVSGLIGVLRKGSARCRGVSQAQMEEREHWLFVAADHGNQMATMQIGQRFLGRNDPRAEEYLKRAWLAGDLTAASHLSHFYSRNPVGQADFVSAYAYKFIAMSIQNEIVAAGANPSSFYSSDTLPGYSSFPLSPHEQAMSLDIAKDLLGNNQNCCFSRQARW